MTSWEVWIHDRLQVEQEGKTGEEPGRMSRGGHQYLIVPHVGHM